VAEFIEDTEIYPVMISLSACAVESLAKSGLPAADFVTVQPGLTPVQDYVGNGKSCSEIIINMLNSFPANPFPNPDQSATCASELAYQLQIGLFRCAAPMGGTKQSPKPPTPAEQLNSTRQHLADMAAMKRAIACCMGRESRSYVLQGFTPYGPSGNVVGGSWTFLVGQEI
jgi:hypothetical protein